MPITRLRLILDDIRSTHNVGAMLRTCDAAGVELVYACGLTPFPQTSPDSRPPHVASSNTRAIAKTALGAELTVTMKPMATTDAAILDAKALGFTIMVLEQAEGSLSLYHLPQPLPSAIALVVGSETTGVSPSALAAADTIIELPMLGAKESLNVASAAAIALYELRFGQH